MNGALHQYNQIGRNFLNIKNESDEECKGKKKKEEGVKAAKEKGKVKEVKGEEEEKERRIKEEGWNMKEEKEGKEEGNDEIDEIE